MPSKTNKRQTDAVSTVFAGAEVRRPLAMPLPQSMAVPVDVLECESISKRASVNKPLRKSREGESRLSPNQRALACKFTARKFRGGAAEDFIFGNAISKSTYVSLRTKYRVLINFTEGSKYSFWTLLIPAQ
jgi:hypothetical protein